jgi:hypothetical protein
MDAVTIDHVPTLAETIGDLADKPLSWEGSPDGHMTLDIVTSRDVKKIAELATEHGVPWLPREKVGRVVCRLGTVEQRSCVGCKDAIRASRDDATLDDYDPKEVTDPHGFVGLDMSWARNIHRKTNLYAVVRWRGDDPARVVTGGFLEDAVHPWLDRTMTYREAARIQGFPDDWTMMPARGDQPSQDISWASQRIAQGKTGASWLGKGIPVEAGRWIASGVMRSLNDDPGPIQGYEIGPREHLIDRIGSYKVRQTSLFE